MLENLRGIETWWDAVITQPIMFYLIYLIIYNWLILSTGMYFCERVDHQRVPVNNRAFVPAVAPHGKLRLFFLIKETCFSHHSQGRSWADHPCDWPCVREGATSLLVSQEIIFGENNSGSYRSW